MKEKSVVQPGSEAEPADAEKLWNFANISALVTLALTGALRGMDIKQVLDRLKGNRCGLEEVLRQGMRTIMACEFSPETRVSGTGVAMQEQAPCAKQRDRDVVPQQAVEPLQSTKYVQSIQYMTIPSCDGRQTMRCSHYLFNTDTNWGFQDESSPTGETQVAVGQLVQPGTVVDIFASFGRRIHDLALTTHQFIEFFQTNRKGLYQGADYVFLLNNEGAEQFVIGAVEERVQRGVQRFWPYTYPFQSTSPWKIGNHPVVIIVPAFPPKEQE